MTRIKICGLFRPCDVNYVNEAKPDWCGFVVNFPKSHRNVTPDQVRKLRERLDSHVTPVGVFVNQPVENVAALLNDGTIAAAQLHGSEDGAYIAALRAAAPGCEIWKAFQVRTEHDLEEASASPADLVVLDGGYGAGKVFDWSLAGGFQRPCLLAGGLNPDNLSAAVETLHPWGVDLSSGVELDKKKNREKILAAVAAARKEGK